VRRRLFIPDAVKESISQHLYASTAEAVNGYLSGHEDEDSLTGDLGASLRIGTQTVHIPEGQEVSGSWTWSITYYKFRGRGKKATEKVLGADGIFELAVNWGTQNNEKKCLLFQAKNQWQEKDQKLFEQCIKLSTWREAAFVLNYAPNNYEAFFIDDVIKAGGSRAPVSTGISLASFLSRHFLECLIGDTDLAYDAKSRTLSWRALNGEKVATKFSVGHRFSIKINPPKRRQRRKDESREIANDEVYGYRMQISEEDMLSLKPDYTEKDLKKARQKLAQIYHTDLNPGMDELYREIMNRRMQEMNNARDILYARVKR
jgi:hypothetical protein